MQFPLRFSCFLSVGLPPTKPTNKLLFNHDSLLALQCMQSLLCDFVTFYSLGLAQLFYSLPHNCFSVSQFLCTICSSFPSSFPLAPDSVTVTHILPIDSTCHSVASPFISLPITLTEPQGMGLPFPFLQGTQRISYLIRPEEIYEQLQNNEKSFIEV